MSTNALMLDDLDASAELYLNDARSRQDPYPFYKRMRESDPVHRCESGMWLITSYAAAMDLFRSPNINRGASTQIEWLSVLDDMSTDADRDALRIWVSSVESLHGADHTRLRKLITKTFTPRAVQSWRARIDKIVEAAMIECREKGTFDLLPEFAYPVAELTICEVLGVPFEDRERVAGWSKISSSYNRVGALGNQRKATRDAIVAFINYMSDLVAERRRVRPDEPDALVDSLIMAEEDGDRLTADEVVAIMTSLVQAGHHTTANLIANGTLALLTHPDQFEHLAHDPELVPGAVEEMLRFTGPARSNPRRADVDTVIGAVTIPAGERAFAPVDAADRDPLVFADPDKFDIHRTPNPHVAFAAGAHFCVGAALARIETQSAMTAIAGLHGRLLLASDSLEWSANHSRTLVDLPVAIGS